ncbi:hypothetical protein [Shinella sp. M27]|uniref:hypothetical protein n=1 Tax=Shinella sp. M27 TaxID=3368614 RepID=UPI003B9EAF22
MGQVTPFSNDNENMDADEYVAMSHLAAIKKKLGLRYKMVPYLVDMLVQEISEGAKENTKRTAHDPFFKDAATLDFSV